MTDTTHPRPKLHADCFKVRHPTMLAAQTALASARRKGRQEKHVYYCTLCRAYHLTKMERR